MRQSEWGMKRSDSLDSPFAFGKSFMPFAGARKDENKDDCRRMPVADKEQDGIRFRGVSGGWNETNSSGYLQLPRQARARLSVYASWREPSNQDRKSPNHLLAPLG
jgi:hypothetical protein